VLAPGEGRRASPLNPFPFTKRFRPYLTDEHNQILASLPAVEPTVDSAIDGIVWLSTIGRFCDLRSLGWSPNLTAGCSANSRCTANLTTATCWSRSGLRWIDFESACRGRLDRPL